MSLDEPYAGWCCVMQARYSLGDLLALDRLMGLPAVEETLGRVVRQLSLAGDEDKVRERARKSLARKHSDYDPDLPFEPWASKFIRQAAQEQKNWRKRPRQIWKAIASEVVTTNLERLAVDIRADLSPAIASLTSKQRQVLYYMLSGYSVRQIAAKMDVEEREVWSIKYQALRLLREKLMSSAD